jgi:ribonuclease HI
LDNISIYTDGACRGNPGPGGWGALIISGQDQRTLKGSEADTTNNRMELSAVIFALESLHGACDVELYTDSKYVMDGLNQWLPNWKARGWKTANRKPVKNQDLWQRLDSAVARHQINWHWVKGHNGNVGNEQADALANLAIDEFHARGAQ